MKSLTVQRAALSTAFALHLESASAITVGQENRVSFLCVTSLATQLTECALDQTDVSVWLVGRGRTALSLFVPNPVTSLMETNAFLLGFASVLRALLVLRAISLTVQILAQIKACVFKAHVGTVLVLLSAIVSPDSKAKIALNSNALPTVLVTVLVSAQAFVLATMATLVMPANCLCVPMIVPIVALALKVFATVTLVSLEQIVRLLLAQVHALSRVPA